MRIGCDRRIFANVDGARIGHRCILAALAAADQHLAARAARDIEAGCANHADLAAENLDLSTRACRAGRQYVTFQHGGSTASIECHFATRCARCAAHAACAQVEFARRPQHDFSRRIDAQSVGTDNPLLVDHRCVDVDPPTSRGQRAQVHRFTVRCGDTQAQVRCTGVDQIDAAACSQHHLAAGCIDQPFIAHAAAEQRDAPTEAAAQFALVDDRSSGIAAGGDKVVATTEPVDIVEPQRRGDQAPDIDPGPLPEQDAILIEQPDLPVAAQAAENGRRIVANHAVQHLAGTVWLGEIDAVVAADRKTLPVQNAVGRVGDGHLLAIDDRTCPTRDDIEPARQHSGLSPRR